MQDADQGEEAAGGLVVYRDLALQPLGQHARALVVDAAAAHVDRLDLGGGEAFHGVVVALTDPEIVLDDLAEGRERQVELRRLPVAFAADVEDKAAIADGKWARGGWEGSDEQEKQIKEETGATIRCFPFEQPAGPHACLMTGADAKEVCIFAKSY